MRVQVRFFGPIEHYTHGLSPALVAALPDLELPDGARVDDMLRRLRLLGVPGTVRPFVSINGHYQRENVVLHAEDRIELRPPMTGG